MDMDNEKIIETLYRVLNELEARECSGNSVITEYHGTGWKDLCGIGIELFIKLKN